MVESKTLEIFVIKIAVQLGLYFCSKRICSYLSLKAKGQIPTSQ